MVSNKTDLNNTCQNLFTLLQILPLHIIRTDLKGKIIYINRTFSEKSPSEVESTSLFERILEKDREDFIALFNKAVKSKQPIQKETSVVTPDWELNWFKYSIIPVVRSGTVKEVAVVAEDISDRKKTEKSLRESEEEFRSLAEQSPNMIFISRKGRVVYANKMCEDLMGYTRQEFYAPGFDFFSMFEPESQNLIRKNFARHLNYDEIPPQDSTLVTAQGKRIDAIITTKRLAYEHESAILSIVTDITDRRKVEIALQKAHDTLERRIKTRTAELTQANLQMQLEIDERKKAEDALRTREAMLRSIFDSSPDAITVTDASGTIIDCNQAAVKQAGFSSKQELLNKNAFDRVAPEDRARALANFERTVQYGSVHNVEYRIFNKRGGLFPAELSAAAVKDSRGQIVGFVAVTKDITERKAQEEALIESQAKLNVQKKALEQKNIALGEIIAQVEVDKQKIKDEIALNVQRVLFPILDKWDKKDDPKTIIELLRHHLTDLTSPYGSHITEKTASLTPREIEICNMIKAGLATRDISQLLKISAATVERHRKNIRKKLEITNQKVNLVTYLRNLA